MPKMSPTSCWVFPQDIRAFLRLSAIMAGSVWVVCIVFILSFVVAPLYSSGFALLVKFVKRLKSVV